MRITLPMLRKFGVFKTDFWLMDPELELTDGVRISRDLDFCSGKRTGGRVNFATANPMKILRTSMSMF